VRFGFEGGTSRYGRTADSHKGRSNSILHGRNKSVKGFCRIRADLYRKATAESDIGKKKPRRTH
jgi:superfamily II DNA/RNA helicase